MNREPRSEHENTSISRNEVPADILEIILWLIATDTSHPLEDRCKGVVATSQTCVSWRSAALEARSVWASVIDFGKHSPKWIEELIHRSAPAPLNFGTVDSCVSTYRADIASIFDNQSQTKERIRAINLHVSEQDWKRYDFGFYSQEMPPHIEHFNLQYLAPPLRSFVYPVFTERRQISSLKRLHLRSACFYPANEAFFPHLEELSIDYGYDGRVYIPQLPLSDVLQLLEKAPNLRYLALMNCIVAPTEPYDHLDSVQLNRLELLFIDGTAGTWQSLMNKLFIPTNCGLMMSYNTESPVFENWTRDFIKSRLRLWREDAPNRSFHVRHMLRDWQISFENIIVDSTRHYRDLAPEVFRKKYTSPDPPFMIRLRSMSTDFFISVFSLFRPTYPTTTFLRLWIEWDEEDGDGEREFGELVLELSHMVNLQTLEILDASSPFLFPILEQTPIDVGLVTLLPEEDLSA